MKEPTKITFNKIIQWKIRVSDDCSEFMFNRIFKLISKYTYFLNNYIYYRKYYCQRQQPYILCHDFNLTEKKILISFIKLIKLIYKHKTNTIEIAFL